MRISMLIILFGFTLSVNAVQDFDRQTIEKRIEPIGQVNLKEDTKDTQPVQKDEETPPVETAEVAGKTIYEQYCQVCHQAGVAGAPKFQDEASWKPKLEGRTIDDLLSVAITGINAMPPKGTCMDCSEDDLKAAIEYMLPQS